MRGTLFTMCLVSFLILLFLGNSMALNKEEAVDILKGIMVTGFKILEVREAPLEGFWEVATEVGQEKTIIYIHNSLRYIIIQGQILDRQTKRNLTFERIKDFRNVEISSLPLEDAIPMGEGKRRLYVFTDPGCYFCSQLHEELKRIKDIKTFFFLYPLNPASYEKAKSIWCSQDKIKALGEVYNGKELKSPVCDTRPIDKNIEMGRRLLIQSVPTLILENGKIIEGYASPNTLENLLKSSSK